MGARLQQTLAVELPPPLPSRPTRSSRKERSSGAGGEDLLCDADVIFTVQKLRMANPRIEIFTELTSPASMAFLSPTMPFKGLGDFSPFLLPPYTSGQVGRTCCRGGRGGGLRAGRGFAGLRTLLPSVHLGYTTAAGP